MSGYWVRLNGQAELRENLRAAMRESGRSQRDTIDEAGVGYHHIIGGLAGGNWISLEAVEAVAAVLEVSPEELLGESIYKHERGRYAEYDHPPPEVQAERDAKAAIRAEAASGEDRTRALCCTCGALRSASFMGFEYTPDWDSYNHGRRLVGLWCVQCDTETQHAVLLPSSDADRDAAEAFDHAPTKEQEAQRERDELIGRLACFNVDVHFRAWHERGRRDGWVLKYLYDESKSRWRIEVEELAPARLQHDCIKMAWEAIAANDHQDVLDPTRGLTFGATDSAWADVTDELTQDVSRFLDVERRRMVQHLRARAARGDFAAGRFDEGADR